jgi:hypothetical protein
MMAKRADGKAHSVLSALEARVAAHAVSTTLVAVAGGITLVAVAYAIFATLRGPLSPAGASAVTAFIFALITAALAVLGPKIIKARAAAAEARAAAARPAIDPAALRTGIEVGFAVITTIANAAWKRSHSHKR